MNIDINRDIVVGFDPDGRPLNCWGDLILSPENGSKGLLFSKECLKSLRRAREEIEE